MTQPTALTGRYQGSGRGFGFLIPDGAQARSDDCFIPPHQTGGAWDGDRVEALLQPEDPQQPGRRLAQVVQILERGNQRVTGVIQKVDHTIWLRPDNERLPAPIKVVGKARVREGEKAAVEVKHYGGPSLPPQGVLTATFGPGNSRAAAVEAILYQQDIHRPFPPEVLTQTAKLSQAIPDDALQGRLDLREKTVITIDGAASKDLDDAVSLERVGENWILGVHIADVSFYVQPGSALDEEAFARGTSVYFADQVVPMLPVELSNGICSLNPREDRLTLSCLMTLDPSGTILEHTISKSVIRSAERMTYEDCNLLLSDANPALADHYAHILPMLRDMVQLSHTLERRRKNRGALELESGESYILCDSMGRPVEVLAREQGESEKLIESFMLCANETVAKHLFELHLPAVYRVHEKPSQDKTETLRAMLSPLGYSLPDAGGFSLQKVLDAAKGKPEAPAVSMMILRSMMKARYDTENLGHFGLAAPYYCHFTSPIRRYPDLMVHRCLHALLDKQPAGQRKALAKACEKAAVQSSQRELAAQSAERDIDKLYFADYMGQHLGETFPASVSGLTRFGLFAALPNGVEGFLPVETLPEDHYVYDETHMTLTGERTGQRYTFGMALTVVCVSADASAGRIEFRLPGREDVPSRERRADKPLPSPKHKDKGQAQPRGKRRGNRPAMHVPKRGRRGKRR